MSRQLSGGDDRKYRIGNAPTSWGVEVPNAAGNPPWTRFLDEVASSGYAGVELGPYGYLPTAAEQLGPELARRRLSLTAGYVLDRLWDEEARASTLEGAQRICALLGELGARHLVLIASIVPERTATAGRTSAARRLTAAELQQLATTVGLLAEVAHDHQLQAGIHPHVGTFVEFEDEIDAVLSDSAVSRCGLVVDTGHLSYAGMDPAAIIRRYADRVCYVHLKDVDAEVLARMLAQGADFWDAYRAGVFCVLGNGSVNFGSVRSALAEIGYEGWLTVEQDADPAGSSDPQVDAMRSLEFLDAKDLVR